MRFERKKFHTPVLCGLILLYVLYFSLISWIKLRTFSFHDFDLAVHDLSAWNILRGSIFNSILNIPFLGNHMNLILFLIAPLYLILSSPLTLLFLQSLSLGLAALPLYLLGRKILNEDWGLLIAGIYLFYPALNYTNLYEFHPTAFATLFLTFAFYYYELKSFSKFLLFSALACLCQENMPLAVIMFGALALFERRGKKWVIVPFFFGTIYLVIALLAQSYFNNNTVQFFSIYRHLGDSPSAIALNLAGKPWLVFQALLRKEVLVYLLQIFLPLAFLPLLSPLKLLPAAPFLLQHMLSNRATDLAVYFHYNAEIIPFVFVSLIFSLGLILKKNWVKGEGFLKITLLAALFLSRFAFGPSFLELPKLISSQSADYLDSYKRELLKKIPNQDEVAATFEFLPHLTHRKRLYSFHHVYTGYHTLSNKPYLLPEGAKTALIDFNDQLTFGGFYNPAQYKNVAGFLSGGKWHVVDMMDTIALMRKGMPAGYPLFEVVKDGGAGLPDNLRINVGGEIELMGCAFKEDFKAAALEIAFYWKSLRQTGKDIYIFLDIEDNEGGLLMRKFRPICYMAMPTFTWRQGQVIAERCRIKLPETVPQAGYRVKIGFFERKNGLICKIAQGADTFGRALLFERKE